jgi:phosphatidate cytidylyltransferase
MLGRIITGLILIVLGVYLITNGGMPFYLFILITMLLSTYEFFQMTKNTNKLIMSLFLLMMTLIFISIIPISLDFAPKSTPQLGIARTVPFVLLTLSILLLSIIELKLKRLFFMHNSWIRAMKILLFMLCTFPFLYLIRIGENGQMNIWFVCLLIWVGDTFAFFGGKLFGKHSLSELSPKKTIEGSVIGLCGGLLSALVFVLLFKLHIWLYMSLALYILVFAQIGDLHESLTKRFFKAKDSSHFLPGHGGFYDRADSYLLVAPVIFFIFNL